MIAKPTLRKTTEIDLPFLFEQQFDNEAGYMSAFTSKEWKDEQAYISKWKRLLQDPSVHQETIMIEGAVAGTVAKFEINGEAHITYAVAKEFWRKGIASIALKKFLVLEKKRPIYGHAAADNTGSVKVLEKCGFKFIRKQTGFARAREKEIEEVVYWLPD
jgi:[ribosomal protein S5]-alanine N-acetyltransferase